MSASAMRAEPSSSAASSWSGGVQSTEISVDEEQRPRREHRSKRKTRVNNVQKLLDDAKFEPREVNFVKLCRQFHPDKTPSQLTCKEQVALIQYALSKRDGVLIDPHCTFMKYFDLVIAVALIFTGVVTPYEVIFMKTVSAEDWLFFVNRIVDLIFVVDMTLQFFLKVPVSQPGNRGTVLLKNRSTIRRKYLTSWFPLDVIGILPFDIVFLLYDGSESFSGVKILRCVRLLRLAKLVRILRSSRIILRWQSYYGISFGSQKLAKFSVILLLASHWMACLWGFTGLTFGADLCDANGVRFEGVEIPPDDMSWVASHFVGSSSPDDPCNPWHVYSASLHWSVMTITSIGYGDITPVRNGEYIVCVLCMLAGGVLWAYTIGSLCSIMANGDPVETEFETNTDRLNAMMEVSGVCESKRQSFREYLRESKKFDTMIHFREVASKFSPKLKGELLVYTCRSWKRSVFYFAKFSDFSLTVLADKTSVHFYARNEELYQQSLCLVEQGTLASAGRILLPGDAFNIDCIVTENLWRRFPRNVALTYSMVLTLDREQLVEVGDQDPKLQKELRMAAARIAGVRAIVACAQRAKSMPQGSAGRPTLQEVFDIIVEEPDIEPMDGVSSARNTLWSMSSGREDVNSVVPPSQRPNTIASSSSAMPPTRSAFGTHVNRAVASIPDQAPRSGRGQQKSALEALEKRLDLMQEQMQQQFQEARALLRQAAAQDAHGFRDDASTSSSLVALAV